MRTPSSPEYVSFDLLFFCLKFMLNFACFFLASNDDQLCASLINVLMMLIEANLA